MTPTVDVIIPTIPPRKHQRAAALDSVQAQTHQPRHVHLVVDHAHQGAAATRNRGLERAMNHPDGPPDLVAFLDDDDWWYPNHLQTHTELHRQGADFSYSWFDGASPFPQHRGRQFDPADPHHTTITVVVARWVAQQVRFRLDHPPGWELPQEDWRYILDCRDAGARFLGTGEVTWHYSLHGLNTCGLGDRW